MKQQENDKEKKEGLKVAYRNQPSPTMVRNIVAQKNKLNTMVLLALTGLIISGAVLAYFRIQASRPATMPAPPPEEDITTVERAARAEPAPNLPPAYLRGHSLYKEYYDRYAARWAQPELDAPDAVAMQNGAMLVGNITAIDEDSVTIRTRDSEKEIPIADMKYFSRVKFSRHEYADYMALKMLEHDASKTLE